MTSRTRHADLPSYVTKDGSEIRELMHPDQQSVRNQSLAEAIVQPGEKTRLHSHRTTEELYHITHGTGLMTLGNQRFNVVAGDTVLIPPCTPHCIEATGSESLRILCCCSPAYSHEDTEIH